MKVLATAAVGAADAVNAVDVADAVDADVDTNADADNAVVSGDTDAAGVDYDVVIASASDNAISVCEVASDNDVPSY